MSNRSRKIRRLPPHQYCLRLYVIKDPIIAPPPKPHLIYRGERWHLYRNKWKSQFRMAAAIGGTTIAEVMQRLTKAHNNYQYGFHIRRST